MAEKLFIASGKGGVGKSTFTAFLGRVLDENNKKVLLIDADAGLGSLDIMLGVSDITMNTWYDAVVGNCSFRDSVIEIDDNLHLIPAPKNMPESIPDDVFSSITKEFSDSYDYIIIDGAAGIDMNFSNALKAADKAIFIATADEISVKAASAAASEAEKHGFDRDMIRLVINRFQKKAALKSRLLNIDGTIDRSGVMLLGVLPEDKLITYSSVTGTLPSKKSSFIKAVKRISGRIDGKNIPLLLKELK